MVTIPNHRRSLWPAKDITINSSLKAGIVMLALSLFKYNYSDQAMTESKSTSTMNGDAC